MKISAVRVTPIAIKDPALLNAAGVHEPFGLRSIIEVVGANGMVGLGETYGDAPVLDLLTRVKDSLVGLSAFDVNGLLAMVKAEAKLTKTAHIEMELAPGSMGDNLTSSVFSGFEVAFLDLQARSLGIPLVELLGGAVRKLPVAERRNFGRRQSAYRRWLCACDRQTGLGCRVGPSQAGRAAPGIFELPHSDT